MNIPDLSDVTLNTSDTAYRIVVACKIVNHIRERLDTGERYSGIWTPNLQSAVDALYIPFDTLLESMETVPKELTHLRPTPQEVAECAKSLAGGGALY